MGDAKSERKVDSFPTSPYSNFERLKLRSHLGWIREVVLDKIQNAVHAHERTGLPVEYSLVTDIDTILSDLISGIPDISDEDPMGMQLLNLDEDDTSEDGLQHQIAYLKQLILDSRKQLHDQQSAYYLLQAKCKRKDKVLTYLQSTLWSELILLKAKTLKGVTDADNKDDIANQADFGMMDFMQAFRDLQQEEDDRDQEEGMDSETREALKLNRKAQIAIKQLEDLRSEFAEEKRTLKIAMDSAELKYTEADMKEKMKALADQLRGQIEKEKETIVEEYEKEKFEMAEEARENVKRYERLLEDEKEKLRLEADNDLLMMHEELEFMKSEMKRQAERYKKQLDDEEVRRKHDQQQQMHMKKDVQQMQRDFELRLKKEQQRLTSQQDDVIRDKRRETERSAKEVEDIDERLRGTITGADKVTGELYKEREEKLKLHKELLQVSDRFLVARERAEKANKRADRYLSLLIDSEIMLPDDVMEAIDQDDDDALEKYRLKEKVRQLQDENKQLQKQIDQLMKLSSLQASKIQETEQDGTRSPDEPSDADDENESKRSGTKGELSDSETHQYNGRRRADAKPIPKWKADWESSMPGPSKADAKRAGSGSPTSKSSGTTNPSASSPHTRPPPPADDLVIVPMAASSTVKPVVDVPTALVSDANHYKTKVGLLPDEQTTLEVFLQDFETEGPHAPQQQNEVGYSYSPDPEIDNMISRELESITSELQTLHLAQKRAAEEGQDAEAENLSKIIQRVQRLLLHARNRPKPSGASVATVLSSSPEPTVGHPDTSSNAGTVNRQELDNWSFGGNSPTWAPQPDEMATALSSALSNVGESVAHASLQYNHKERFKVGREAIPSAHVSLHGFSEHDPNWQAICALPDDDAIPQPDDHETKSTQASAESNNNTNKTTSNDKLNNGVDTDVDAYKDDVRGSHNKNGRSVTMSTSVEQQPQEPSVSGFGALNAKRLIAVQGTASAERTQNILKEKETRLQEKGQVPRSHWRPLPTVPLSPFGNRRDAFQMPPYYESTYVADHHRLVEPPESAVVKRIVEKMHSMASQCRSMADAREMWFIIEDDIRDLGVFERIEARAYLLVEKLHIHRALIIRELRQNSLEVAVLSSGGVPGNYTTGVYIAPHGSTEEGVYNEGNLIQPHSTSVPIYTSPPNSAPPSRPSSAARDRHSNSRPNSAARGGRSRPASAASSRVTPFSSRPTSASSVRIDIDNPPESPTDSHIPKWKDGNIKIGGVQPLYVDDPQHMPRQIVSTLQTTALISDEEDSDNDYTLVQVPWNSTMDLPENRPYPISKFQSHLGKRKKRLTKLSNNNNDNYSTGAVGTTCGSISTTSVTGESVGGGTATTLTVSTVASGSSQEHKKRDKKYIIQSAEPPISYSEKIAKALGCSTEILELEQRKKADGVAKPYSVYPADARGKIDFAAKARKDSKRHQISTAISAKFNKRPHSASFPTHQRGRLKPMALSTVKTPAHALHNAETTEDPN